MSTQYSPGQTALEFAKSRSLAIEIDENASIMTISSYPDFISEIVLGVAFVALLFSFAKTDEVVCMAFMIFFLIGIVNNVYQKRVLKSVIMKSDGIIQYIHGGVLGSNWNKKEMNFLISEIADFEIGRFHTWGRPDQFQVSVILSTEERINLSGKIQPRYSDCRAKTELIKNFVNAKLSILEFGNP